MVAIQLLRCSEWLFEYNHDVLVPRYGPGPSKATLWDVICPFYRYADIKRTTEILKDIFNTSRTFPQ